MLAYKFNAPQNAESLQYSGESPNLGFAGAREDAAVSPGASVRAARVA